MNPLPQAPKNDLAGQLQASELLIVELETRVAQLTSQLVAANASLKREVADRNHSKAEFRRSTEQLRELSARLQTVREEERTQIARAIHDELGQTLIHRARTTRSGYSSPMTRLLYGSI